MTHQPSSVRTYLVVYIALLALTGLTVLLVVLSDQRTDPPGAGELVIALAIASVKTALVGWFFMHLMHAPRLVYLFLAGGVFFLVVMITLTLGDYWTRGWSPWSSPHQLPR